MSPNGDNIYRESDGFNPDSNAINNSIEAATAFAEQIKQWSRDNEAFIRSLGDTQEALQNLTQEFKEQKELREACVDAEQQLRDISAQVRDNAKDTAQAYQQVASVLNGLGRSFGANNMYGPTGMMGMNMGMGSNGLYYPNMAPYFSNNDPYGLRSQAQEQEADEASLAPELGGDPIRRMAERLKETSATINKEEFQLATMGFEEPSGGGGGSDWSSTFEGLEVPDPTVPPKLRGEAGGEYGGKYSLGERTLRDFLSIPGYGPGARAARALRYYNRATGGEAFRRWGEKSWIVGRPVQDISPELRAKAEAAFAEHHDTYAADKLANYEALGTSTSPLSARSGVTDMDQKRAYYKSELAKGGATRTSLLSELPADEAAAAMAAGNLEKAGILKNAPMKLRGGLLGLGARFAPVLGGAMVGIGVGLEAYQQYANYVRGGQEYAALTGATPGIGTSNQMMGLKLSALYHSGFGLNPTLSYGTAMEINKTALAEGLKSTGLNRDYTGFARQMASTYSMSPQQSMDIYQAGAIRGGMTSTQLTRDLRNLGGIANASNTNFQQLQQVYTGNLQNIASIGGRGGLVGSLVQAGSTQMLGNLAMGQTANSMNLFNSVAGQAMVASAAGVPLTDVYGMMNSGKSADKIKLFGAADNFVKQQLQNIVGVSPRSPSFSKAVQSKAIQLTYVLQALVPPQNGQTAWDEKSAVLYTQNLLSGKGGIVGEATSNAISTLDRLSGGKGLTTGQGLKNFFNNVLQDGKNYRDKSLGGRSAEGLIFRDHGRNRIVTKDDISHMSTEDQKQLYRQISQGKNIAEYYTDDKGRRHQGKWRSLGTIVGDPTLNALETSAQARQQMLGLSPQAQVLVRLIQDPTSVTRAQMKAAARRGRTGGSSSWNNSSDSSSYF